MSHEEIGATFIRISEQFLADEGKFLIDLKTLLSSSMLFCSLSPKLRQRLIDMIADDFKTDSKSLSVGLFEIFKVNLN